METIFLIGRILLGGYFLYNAYQHLFRTKDLAGYAESKGVSQPKVAVIVSGLLLLIGGYTILTGARPEVGVAALVLFFIPVTFQMHAFWKDGNAGEKVNFYKNLALLGAVLMLLMIPEPWPLSLANL